MAASSIEHGGDLLAELLLLHGVGTVFGLPGGQTAALYDAIYQRRPEIDHVMVRDERTTAYAADAFARLTGRVGVCDATVGPGTAKLPSGLGEAYNSSIPVLAIVSDLPSATEARRYRGATSQAMDQETLLQPVTKWQATVRRVQDMAPLVRRAFREMTTGRPGPVALIFPQDLLDGAVDEATAAQATDPHAATFGRFPALRATPDPHQLDAVAEALHSARRPLFILGGGALMAGAADIAATTAEAYGAAVATTMGGKGCIDERHPLSVGVLGSMGTAAARDAAQQADLLVFVGSKAGSVGTVSWSLPQVGQSVAQIDVDPAELGRDFPVDAYALADARLALEALTERARDGAADRSEWAATVASLASQWREQRLAESASDDAPIHPQRVLGELRAHAPDDSIIVADASLASGWLGAYFEQPGAGRRMLFPRGLAGLGWALPAAIGASFAAPGKRVVALVGDGAFAYAVGELSVLVQRRLPVTVLMLNNSSYGWIRWYRRITFGRGWEEDDFQPTNFSAVAAAYGIDSTRVEKPGDLADAFTRSLAVDGPSFIEVLTSVWDTPVAAHITALESGTAAGYGT